jgi:hypothetical protein
MLRVAHQMVTYGLIDAAGGREFELNNTVTRLLAKLLDLPSPHQAQADYALDGAAPSKDEIPPHIGGLLRRP